MEDGRRGLKREVRLHAQEHLSHRLMVPIEGYEQEAAKLGLDGARS